jgi:RimJ/RimL family protein N-acetyltransferase
VQVKHGFESLNLNRIMLVVYDDNARAIRAYEKAGFVLEGSMRQARYRHGKYGDELIMSILRSEWDAANKLEE